MVTMSRYVMQSVITYKLKLKFILVKVKEIMSRLCNGETRRHTVR